MRIVMALLTVAGNFAATVALMLSLSMAGSVGLSTSATAEPSCDPRHYFCFPCGVKLTNIVCKRNCCDTLAPETRKPD